MKGSRVYANKYDRYLRLPALLELQAPRTSPEDPDVYRSELFFIVVHQAAELIAQQALSDLDAVVDPQTHRTNETSHRRAAALMGLARQLIGVLEHLPREHFMAFRERIGGISACQSRQFARLLKFAGRGGELADLSAELHNWRAAHCELAARMLGDAPGTGGSSGVAYLRARVGTVR
jgi:tryptophan 2,3-dioxygenase